ncbi:hypothetical protein SAY87_022895 [Trapa incisa]|uniref:Senescence-associated protein n=1 Tax=Trapa incisa TaxID=236973 RepID=A0AAN7K7A1_9MYRT|nr:hypothetical protein SAY87_022895 [Trapa incisa]
MGCFRCGGSRRDSNPQVPNSSGIAAATQQNSKPRMTKQQVLLQIPSCTVHLMDQGEALELSNGREFTLLTILDENISLATIIKVGDDLQWPLTKDEPVVKLDSFHYLFSLPVKDGDPLSYGVTFMEQYASYLGSLDKFLEDHSCFSSSASSISSSYPASNQNIDWKEFAPRINDYNSVLARAIAGGTGQIVKGIFMCSNAYTNQVCQNLVLHLLFKTRENKKMLSNRCLTLEIMTKSLVYSAAGTDIIG